MERRKVVGFLKQKVHEWSRVFRGFTNNVGREA